MKQKCFLTFKDMLHIILGGSSLCGSMAKDSVFNIHLHSNGITHILLVTGHAGESEMTRVVLRLATLLAKKTRLDTEERVDAGWELERTSTTCLICLKSETKLTLLA